MFQSRMGARTTSLVQFCFSISTLEIYLSYLPAFPHQHPFCLYIACSLVGFWTDKPGWCWFVVRGKHCWLVDKPWLKPISEQAEYLLGSESLCCKCHPIGKPLCVPLGEVAAEEQGKRSWKVYLF